MSWGIIRASLTLTFYELIFPFAPLAQLLQQVLSQFQFLLSSYFVFMAFFPQQNQLIQNQNSNGSAILFPNLQLRNNQQQKDKQQMKKIRTMLGASILAADFANLQSECQTVINFGVDFLHVDIMDGHFVNNLTIGPPIVSCLRKKLPNAYLDCHLMVTHPENYLQALAKAKINCFTFHYQTSQTNIKDFLSKIKQHKIDAGVSLKPGTEVPKKLVQLIRQGFVDKVLIMTVQPGFGGQKFIQSTMSKVKQLRQQFQNLDIEVDGGLNQNTVKISVKSGANQLVAGSTIFGQIDRKEAIHKLKAASQSVENK